MPRATWDASTGTAYVYARSFYEQGAERVPVARTEAVDADVSIDYDAEGRVLGIEIVLERGDYK